VRFPADESCDFSVVRALRAVGHDIVAVAELWPRAEDTIVMERAVRGARILITEVLGSRLAVRHCEIARPFL